jgi:hypothetical protein
MKAELSNAKCVSSMGENKALIQSLESAIASINTKGILNAIDAGNCSLIDAFEGEISFSAVQAIKEVFNQGEHSSHVHLIEGYGTARLKEITDDITSFGMFNDYLTGLIALKDIQEGEVKLTRVAQRPDGVTCFDANVHSRNGTVKYSGTIADTLITFAYATYDTPDLNAKSISLKDDLLQFNLPSPISFNFEVGNEIYATDNNIVDMAKRHISYMESKGSVFTDCFIDALCKTLMKEAMDPADITDLKNILLLGVDRKVNIVEYLSGSLCALALSQQHYPHFEKNLTSLIELCNLVGGNELISRMKEPSMGETMTKSLYLLLDVLAGERDMLTHVAIAMKVALPETINIDDHVSAVVDTYFGSLKNNLSMVPECLASLALSESLMNEISSLNLGINKHEDHQLRDELDLNASL